VITYLHEPTQATPAAAATTGHLQHTLPHSWRPWYQAPELTQDSEVSSRGGSRSSRSHLCLLAHIQILTTKLSKQTQAAHDASATLVIHSTPLHAPPLQFPPQCMLPLIRQLQKVSLQPHGPPPAASAVAGNTRANMCSINLVCGRGSGAQAHPRSTYHCTATTGNPQQTRILFLLCLGLCC
jgi:hypothetical protein